MTTKEFKITGGFRCLLLLFCYLSIVGSAISITEYDSKAITPVFNNESYFSFYNDDSQTYQVYIYNHTGNNSSCDGIIGRVEPHQSIYLPKNASYYLYCEYPDSLKLESIEEVKQGVNQYWVIVVVLIVIIVALYTAIKIVRGRRY
jgi:hypothetical protein